MNVAGPYSRLPWKITRYPKVGHYAPAVLLVTDADGKPLFRYEDASPRIEQDMEYLVQCANAGRPEGLISGDL